MNTFINTKIITIGLAIFSMLFGAGNLMYPLQVGMVSGEYHWIGILGFLMTAVCLPILGFLSMILFDGNYKAFFHRLGNPAGNVLIGACMMIIGPLIAMPRITTLSHTMTAPFLPSFLTTITPITSLIFALIFLGITFLLTARENKIVAILGKVISPLLLASLVIIIIKGILYPQELAATNLTPWSAFFENMRRGYETLDLLAALFFSSILLSILHATLPEAHKNHRQLISIALKASIIGVILLALVYLGMSLLGAYHGAQLHGLNAGELFRTISYAILGAQGALVIATAVLMACLSTAIALTAVVAEYTQHEIFHNRITYMQALIIVLIACLPLSVAGLGSVLSLTGGIITYVGYPVLIMLTVCNLAYKTCNFTPVQVPVLITAIIALLSYYFPLMHWF